VTTDARRPLAGALVLTDVDHASALSDPTPAFVLLHDRLEALGRCCGNRDLDADVSVLGLRHEIGMVLGLLVTLTVVVEKLSGPAAVPDELSRIRSWPCPSTARPRPSACMSATRRAVPADRMTRGDAGAGPSYRGRRWDSLRGGMVWSDTFRSRSEVLTWLGAQIKGAEAVAQRAAAGPLFSTLADEWLDGVRSGAVGRRKGRSGIGYSPTTLEGYERSLRYVLGPEFGARPAADIDDREWQTWVDRLSREGLSRSRIANHLAVARAIYGWAARPTRRLVERNPLFGIELPPNDEKPRTRVADAEEAAALLAALPLATRSHTHSRSMPGCVVPRSIAWTGRMSSSRDIGLSSARP
jgi:Phage integrase, N-terminal SAM-like domain